MRQCSGAGQGEGDFGPYETAAAVAADAGRGGERAYQDQAAPVLAVRIGDQLRSFLSPAISNGDPHALRVPAHLDGELAALAAAGVPDGVAGQLGGDADQVIARLAFGQHRGQPPPEHPELTGVAREDPPLPQHRPAGGLISFR